MVLKGVPSILSPDLLHALASMGHGDKIVLADANFPSASICTGEESPRLVRADGHTIPSLLQAVLTLMPLDTYVFAPVRLFLSNNALNTEMIISNQVCLMDLVNRDKNTGMKEPPVWAEYQGIIDQAEGRRCEMTKVERSEKTESSSQQRQDKFDFRFEFYKQAKESFVVVHTGETALYGNIILQKGVIAPQ